MKTKLFKFLSEKKSFTGKSYIISSISKNGIEILLKDIFEEFKNDK